MTNTPPDPNPQSGHDQKHGNDQQHGHDDIETKRDEDAAEKEEEDGTALGESREPA
jgi:hypothetical protein